MIIVYFYEALNNYIKFIFKKFMAINFTLFIFLLSYFSCVKEIKFYDIQDVILFIWEYLIAFHTENFVKNGMKLTIIFIEKYAIFAHNSLLLQKRIFFSRKKKLI